MAAVCGIDWAAEWHDVRVADEHGTRCLPSSVSRTTRHGIGALIAR